jgi:hypothetical protein
MREEHMAEQQQERQDFSQSFELARGPNEHGLDHQFTTAQNPDIARARAAGEAPSAAPNAVTDDSPAAEER